MVKIVYESRFSPLKTCYYDYSHTAKSILLLAGYLPSEDDEGLYTNMYARETARLTLER